MNITPFGEIMKWRALFIFLFLLGFAGCKINGPNDTGRESHQTIILSARAIPDVVAPGDTVQFVCRIKDSTNTKFRFYWYTPNGTPIGGKDTTYGGLRVRITSENRIKWKAPDKSNVYDFEVFVDDGDTLLLPVDEAFSVTVRQ